MYNPNKHVVNFKGALPQKLNPNLIKINVEVKTKEYSLKISFLKRSCENFKFFMIMF